MAFRQYEVIALRPVRVGRVDSSPRRTEPPGFHYRHAAACDQSQDGLGFERGDANVARQTGDFGYVHSFAPLFSCTSAVAFCFWPTLYATGSE